MSYLETPFEELMKRVEPMHDKLPEPNPFVPHWVIMRFDPLSAVYEAKTIEEADALCRIFTKLAPGTAFGVFGCCATYKTDNEGVSTLWQP